MGSSVDVVSQEGFFSRLKNSFKGIIIGLLFLAGSSFGLWWNEGNLVAEQEAILELQTNMVYSEKGRPDAKLDNKPIHIYAQLWTNQKIGDDLLLKPDAHIKYKREISMYQWVEKQETTTKKKVGGKKTKKVTYSYEKSWSPGRMDSSQFKNSTEHKNPPLLVKEKSEENKNTYYGGFYGNSVAKKLSPKELIKFDVGDKEAQATLQKLEGLNEAKVKNLGTEIYISPTGKGSPEAPVLGDMKLSYKVLKPAAYSVIGQTQKHTLMAYKTKSGKSKLLVEKGPISAANMIGLEESRVNTLAWIVRGAGWFFMFLGLALLLSPFTTALSFLPFVESIGRVAVFMFSFVTSAAIASSIIAVAWLAYRPIYGLGAIAAVTLMLIMLFGKSKKSPKPSAKVQGQAQPNELVSQSAAANATPLEAAPDDDVTKPIEETAESPSLDKEDQVEATAESPALDGDDLPTKEVPAFEPSFRKASENSQRINIPSIDEGEGLPDNVVSINTNSDAEAAAGDDASAEEKKVA